MTDKSEYFDKRISHIGMQLSEIYKAIMGDIAHPNEHGLLEKVNILYNERHDRRKSNFAVYMWIAGLAITLISSSLTIAFQLGLARNQLDRLRVDVDNHAETILQFKVRKEN
jgi:hypothetical protein